MTEIIAVVIIHSAVLLIMLAILISEINNAQRIDKKYYNLRMEMINMVSKDEYIKTHNKMCDYQQANAILRAERKKYLHPDADRFCGECEAHWDNAGGCECSPYEYVGNCTEFKEAE